MRRDEKGEGQGLLGFSTHHAIWRLAMATYLCGVPAQCAVRDRPLAPGGDAMAHPATGPQSEGGKAPMRTLVSFLVGILTENWPSHASGLVPQVCGGRAVPVALALRPAV